MSFIDWSDPEGVFDMLVEYVADEKNDAQGDPRREQFLGKLVSQLTAAQTETQDLPEIMGKLKQIVDSMPAEFVSDSVMDHLTACLEELERIKLEAGR